MRHAEAVRGQRITPPGRRALTDADANSLPELTATSPSVGHGAQTGPCRSTDNWTTPGSVLERVRQPLCATRSQARMISSSVQSGFRIATDVTLNHRRLLVPRTRITTSSQGFTTSRRGETIRSDHGHCGVLVVKGSEGLWHTPVAAAALKLTAAVVHATASYMAGAPLWCGWPRVPRLHLRPVLPASDQLASGSGTGAIRPWPVRRPS
jgi:hypothetical protein